MKLSKPTPTFVIPEYIADEVGNSAFKVLGISTIDATVLCSVYDPLDLTDRNHGDLVEFPLADEWIAVQLAPQLFRAA